MFQCQITGRFSRLGDKLQKVTAITRPRNYTKWVKDEESRPVRWIEVDAGSGWEIVKELSCTQEGANLWNSWTAEMRTSFLKQNGFLS